MVSEHFKLCGLTPSLETPAFHEGIKVGLDNAVHGASDYGCSGGAAAFSISAFVDVHPKFFRFSVSAVAKKVRLRSGQ